MDSGAKKICSAGVIEHNKDSPFQILDVRSINGGHTSFNCLTAPEDTGAISDASSGSEKALVIDIAEEDDMQQEADEAQARETGIGETEVAEKKEKPVVVNVRKDRISRRKSQHVPIAADDIVFGMPFSDTDTEPFVDNKEGLKTCMTIAKHNVLLRSTINHILSQRFERNFNFDAASTDRSSFEQLRRWINCYEKIKKQSAAEKANQTK